jgi:hypothetical protein
LIVKDRPFKNWEEISSNSDAQMYDNNKLDAKEGDEYY